jgi:hypothetical protein
VPCLPAQLRNAAFVIASMLEMSLSFHTHAHAL